MLMKINKIKKVLSVCVLLILLLVTFSTINVMAKEGKVLSFAHVFNINHPFHKGIELAAKIVNEKTDGEIKINIFPSSQLGTQKEIFESVMLGNIDMASLGPGYITDVFEPIYICDMPFLWKNLDHISRFIKSDIAKEMYEDLRIETHLNVLGVAYLGTRHITSNKPIRTPDDLKNFKLRVPGIPYYLEIAKAMGSNPTSIPFSEVYMALQQKVIDGQENGLPNIYSMKFYEVQKYINLTGHISNLEIWAINDKVLQGLTEKEQEILKSAFEEGANFASKLIAKNEEDLVPVLKQKGNIFIETDLDAFRKAVSSIPDKYSSKWSRYGENLYQKILDL